MTDKELKKLSRLQLLELLLEQSKENEQLRQDNESYRQQQEAAQGQPAVPVGFDPTVLAGFSEFAEKIDSSLSETRRATQSYIERLSMLAEFAEKSVAGAAPASGKKRAAEIAVTDEDVSAVAQISVKPLKKAKPVKKLEAVSETPAVPDESASVKDKEAASVPQGHYMPVGGYPVMGAPIYQPVPVYYPVPAPAPVPVAPTAPTEAKSSPERRSENGVTVRQLSKKKKEEPATANEDTQLVSALADFYFENPQMLEALPEDIRKKIITRFKR